jgi:hypothetical protein
MILHLIAQIYARQALFVRQLPEREITVHQGWWRIFNSKQKSIDQHQ